MQLVSPQTTYKKSFLDAVKEYQQEGRYTELDIKDLQNNFDAFVQKLQNYSLGKDLPAGYVPETIFWLVDNNEFIGRVSIRHYLTDALKKVGGHIGYDIRPSKRRMGYGKKILALVLPEAKKLGINKALITCDETNIGSKKIIEANGGVLENRVEMGNGKPAKFRYWIQT